jgi:hypothetical protein
MVHVYNVSLLASVHCSSLPYEDDEQAVNARRLKKSVTIYTAFDWSKVPRIEERRQAKQTFDTPEIITHVYR